MCTHIVLVWWLKAAGARGLVDILSRHLDWPHDMLVSRQLENATVPYARI
jgi:hypothetical protein